MRRDPTFRAFYNWSLSPEDPRQPQIVELDVTAKLLDRPDVVIVEFVRKGHLQTAGPRRRYQRYRFFLKHVLECRGDAEWQRRAEEIVGAFWYRINAHNRKLGSTKLNHANP